MRRFAIGDIHGCSKALRTLIDAIDPQVDDELIFLGDYVDRGPDARNVVDQIIALRERCHVVTLRGNHEIMLLGVALGGLNDTVWLNNGGRATVTSYGGCLSRIPRDHYEFFQELLPYYETSDSIFVHAGYDPDLDMHQQEDATIYWNHLPCPLPPRHKSGKQVFVGHTPQPSGKIRDAGHMVCIDTYCFGGGLLTACQVDTKEIIQTDRHGHQKRVSLIANGWDRLRRRMVEYARARREQVKERGQASERGEAKEPGQATENVDAAPVNLVRESAES